MPKAVCLFPPHLIDEARRAHLLGATQFEIGKILGCSQQTAGRRIRDWGWGRSFLRRHRPKPPLSFAPLPAPDDSEDEPADLNPGALAARLKRLLAREMKRAETCGGAPVGMARTLASLGQTLKLLSALPEGEAEEEPVDIQAFKRDIAARLDALRMEGAEERDAEEYEAFAERLGRDFAYVPEAAQPLSGTHNHEG